MARKTVVELVDDIDGSPAEETVVFSLDGTDYEIDLSSAHADQLRTALAPFTGKARKPARTDAPAKPAAPSAQIPERSLEIRAWARQHGIEISERGRIPGQIQQAFDAKDPSLVKTSAQQTVPQVTFKAVSNP